MHLNKNRRLLYLMVFFHNLIPAYAIERLFWQSRGMTVQMVVWCELIYAVTIIVLEMPSGVLADVLGRKKLLVVSAVIPCLEFFLLIFATRFWHFAAVVLLAGVCRSMYSGAQNALLYESLAADGKEDEFEKVVGRMNAADFIAAMIAALSGGFLAFRLGFEFNYWISFGSSLIALVCAVMLREPARKLAGEARDAWHAVVKSSTRFFAGRRDVLRIAANAALIAAITVYLDEFWQLYLDGIAFPVVFFGLTSATLSLARIPGSFLAPRLLRFIKHGTLIWLSSLIFSVFVLLAALFPSAAGMAALIFALGVAAMIEPAALGYLHRRADSAARATIESIMSLAERVIAIPVGLIFSYAAKAAVETGYLAIGLLAGIAACAFAVAGRAKTRRKGQTK